MSTGKKLALKLSQRGNLQFELSKFITFRDRKECDTRERIKKSAIKQHANPEFHIRIIEDPHAFYFEFALDLVTRIRWSHEAGKKFVAILPVGPTPQYDLAARMINESGISCRHLHTFNMDEYADESGNTPPADWPGSFRSSMMENFFLKIDPELRPPLNQTHFPDKTNIQGYSHMIEDAGEADVCYGGIGWCGHIAFWEARLGLEFGDDLKAYKKAGARLVELHPMTIMQNALHSFSGDWSWVPPRPTASGLGYPWCTGSKLLAGRGYRRRS